MLCESEKTWRVLFRRYPSFFPKSFELNFTVELVDYSCVFVCVFESHFNFGFSQLIPADPGNSSVPCHREAEFYCL